MKSDLNISILGQKKTAITVDTPAMYCERN